MSIPPPVAVRGRRWNFERESRYEADEIHQQDETIEQTGDREAAWQ